MDSLDRVLQTVRLSTALLSRAQYSHPWSVETRGADKPIFHAIVGGRCQLGLRAGARSELSWHALNAGDIAILPAGTRHVMASDHRMQPVRVADLPTRGVHPLRVRHGGPGESCHILCGTFTFAMAAATWLLSTLPPLIHIQAPEDEQSWTHATLSLLEREVASSDPGAGTVATRLTDVLVVRALRTHAETAKGDWLSAVADPQIGRALVAIHAEPQKRWTVPDLARCAGLSRTKFFDRFSRLIGDSPARYVAHWRATTAADLLTHEELSVAEVADRVGYDSSRAFVDMFRKHHGVTPSTYRRRARSA